MQSTESRNQKVVPRLAHELHLTYYDASYATAAAEIDATLVTDDEKLRKTLEKGVNTIKKLLNTEIRILSSNEYTNH